MVERRVIQKMPGTEKLTRPEEISILSKYLGDIKEEVSNISKNTFNENDLDYVPGKTTGKIPDIPQLQDSLQSLNDSEVEKVNSLPTEFVKMGKSVVPERLNQHVEELSTEETYQDLKENIEKIDSSRWDEISLKLQKEELNSEKEVKLSRNIDRLKNSNSEIDSLETEKSILELSGINTILSGNIDRLSNSENKVKTLDSRLETIEDKREIELSNNFADTISGVQEINRLETVKESIKDAKTVKELDNTLEKIKGARKEVDLESKKIEIESTKTTELPNKKEIIGATSFLDDEDYNLPKEKEKIETNNISELSTSYEKLKNINDEEELSDYIETIDNTENISELGNHKEKIEDPRKSLKKLPNSLETLEDNKDIDLSAHKETIFDDNETRLSSNIQKLKTTSFLDDEDYNLPEEKEVLEDKSDISLGTDRKDLHVFRYDDKPLELPTGIEGNKIVRDNPRYKPELESDELESENILSDERDIRLKTRAENLIDSRKPQLSDNIEKINLLSSTEIENLKEFSEKLEKPANQRKVDEEITNRISPANVKLTSGFQDDSTFDLKDYEERVDIEDTRDSLKELQEYRDDIELTKDQSRVNLDDTLEKISDERVIDLENKSEKITDERDNVLNQEAIKIRDNRDIELSKAKEELELTYKKTELEDHKETISDIREDSEINSYKNNLEVEEEVYKLSDHLEKLDDTRAEDTLLENHQEEIPDLDKKKNTELENHRENIKDSRSDPELERHVENIQETISSQVDALETYKDTLSDQNELSDLENYKDTIEDGRIPDLENYIDDILDDRDDIYLTDYQEKISDERVIDLSTYEDKIDDDREDKALEDFVDKISPSEVDNLEYYIDRIIDEEESELSNYKEAIIDNKSLKISQEKTLSDTIIKRKDSEKSEYNSDQELSDTVIQRLEDNKDGHNDHNYNPDQPLSNTQIIRSDSDSGSSYTPDQPLSDTIIEGLEDDGKRNYSQDQELSNTIIQRRDSEKSEYNPDQELSNTVIDRLEDDGKRSYNESQPLSDTILTRGDSEKTNYNSDQPLSETIIKGKESEKSSYNSDQPLSDTIIERLEDDGKGSYNSDQPLSDTIITREEDKADQHQDHNFWNNEVSTGNELPDTVISGISDDGRRNYNESQPLSDTIIEGLEDDGRRNYNEDQELSDTIIERLEDDGKRNYNPDQELSDTVIDRLEDDGKRSYNSNQPLSETIIEGLEDDGRRNYNPDQPLSETIIKGKESEKSSYNTDQPLSDTIIERLEDDGKRNYNEDQELSDTIIEGKESEKSEYNESQPLSDTIIDGLSDDGERNYNESQPLSDTIIKRNNDSGEGQDHNYWDNEKGGGELTDFIDNLASDDGKRNYNPDQPLETKKIQREEDKDSGDSHNYWDNEKGGGELPDAAIEGIQDSGTEHTSHNYWDNEKGGGELPDAAIEVLEDDGERNYNPDQPLSETIIDGLSDDGERNYNSDQPLSETIITANKEFEGTEDISDIRKKVLETSSMDDDETFKRLLNLLSEGKNGGFETETDTSKWEAKISALVSAYLSGKTISPERAKEFEDALMASIEIGIEGSRVAMDASNADKKQQTNINTIKSHKTRPGHSDKNGSTFNAADSIKSQRDGEKGYDFAQVPAYKLTGNGGILDALNLNEYVRWAAEKVVGTHIHGSVRRLLLDETLAALVLAREQLEKLAKSNRDRLPGDDIGLLSAAMNGGVSGAIESAKNAVVDAVGDMLAGGGSGHTNPQNRPESKITGKLKDSGVGITQYEVGNERPATPVSTGGGFKSAALSALKTLAQSTLGIGGLSTKDYKDYWGNSVGFGTTLEDLCFNKTDPSSIEKLEDLYDTLKESPYITTPMRFGTITKGMYGTQTLDTNSYWEIVMHPFVCSAGECSNGGYSYLPAVQEINVENAKINGVATTYSEWVPINSFELQKSKLTTKSLQLFDGEINYPVSVEYTNELRLSIVDDSFKSWRKYFERCMDCSVYNSVPHDLDYYTDANSVKYPTPIDKNSFCVAFYKNVTFQITIYILTPQYSTVRKFDLLCVLKDFSEDHSGDVDGSGTDLNVGFSIVGENPDESASDAFSATAADHASTNKTNLETAKKSAENSSLIKLL